MNRSGIGCPTGRRYGTSWQRENLRAENCHDLLLKLEREIDRFAAHCDAEARIDLAFNMPWLPHGICAIGFCGLDFPPRGLA